MGATVLLLFCAPLASPQDTVFIRARENARRFDEIAGRMDRLMKAWLAHADPRTLLLPDRLPGGSRGLKPNDRARLYTPHNSGADLYPYLILTSHLTDPELFHGRMLEMLRNEVRYTTVEDSVPGNLAMSTGKLGRPVCSERANTLRMACWR
jgi:hypothetical protein